MTHDLTYLRTYGCESAGCTHPDYAERGLHAPNCTQSEMDLLLDEYERLRGAIEKHRARKADHEQVHKQPGKYGCWDCDERLWSVLP